MPRLALQIYLPPDKDDRIYVGDDIIIELLETHKLSAKLRITAPEHVIVDRASIRERRDKGEKI